jgi:hypothetical protein
MMTLGFRAFAVEYGRRQLLLEPPGVLLAARQASSTRPRPAGSRCLKGVRADDRNPGTADVRPRRSTLR